ncbi:hypothetical protein PSTT_04846 [Puccinia striiformis]|uniref:Uncharacterized protein n=1 Tax=Puccinia striiformis TaxID=27350 RepID=A0A2S4VRI8_9BASI|nr:hypothetical protein PSTT_04846 [Puccinia striiformis]
MIVSLWQSDQEATISSTLTWLNQRFNVLFDSTKTRGSMNPLQIYLTTLGHMRKSTSGSLTIRMSNCSLKLLQGEFIQEFW